MTTNDILARLRNGESVDDIAAGFAELLNCAVTEYETAAEADRKVAAFNEAMKPMETFMQNYYPELWEVMQSDENKDFSWTESVFKCLDELTESLDAIVMMGKLLDNFSSPDRLNTKSPKPINPKSEDEIFSTFFKQLGI